MFTGRESTNLESQGAEGIPIVIVTRYSLFSEALAYPFCKFSTTTIAGIGSRASDAIDLARRIQPRVMILHHAELDRDIFDVIGQIKSISKNTNLLLLFQPGSDSITLRLLSAGIHGILPPEADFHELRKAITNLSQNKRYLTERIQALCAERFLTADSGKEPKDRLSEREFQVMRLLALGYTNREIGKALSVSVKTIDTHRSNLLKKLDVRNNSDITRFAIRHAYIEI